MTGSQALDPTRLSREVRNELHAQASRIHKRIGTSLYSAYLHRLLPVLEDADRLRPELGDPLRLSSRLLTGVLADAGVTPPWAGEVSVHRDEERVLAQTRATLLGLWQRPNHGWVIRPDRVLIPVREDMRVGAALSRTIPDSLLLPGSTNATLIVQKDGLERLMGVTFARPWWRRT